jgi:mono/diheme cytochrome c family protein
MISRNRLLYASLLLLGTLPGPALAQQHAPQQHVTLTDSQRQGMQLFQQHCGVCHTKPTLLSPVYGPVLYKEKVDGKEAAVREFIQKGTARMPGFQYQLNATQISAVVDFLKTVPEPPPETAPPPRPNAAAQREAD